VYTWCRSGAARLRNIARNPRAAIVAYKGNSYVMVRGAARALTAADEPYARVTRMFLEKYNREETYGNDTLVEITPEKIIER
jgi:hypothetical protein